MPDARSALAGVYVPGRVGAREGTARVAVFERLGRTLVQVSGWRGAFDAVCGALESRLGFPMPREGRIAVSRCARSVFRVGPERLWLAAPADDAALLAIDGNALGDDAVVTDIGQSRTVVRVVGAYAGELLNRGLPVDLDRSVFPPDGVAQSVIHHMPVLVHRVPAGDVSADALDVYVTRDYAVSFWDWLIEAAQSFGCEVGRPE
jgi:sarcosine oxidase subunit gamma